MPIFVASLIGGLVSACGSLVGRVLLALGIGFVAYQGFGALLGSAQSLVTANLQGMPAKVVGMLAVMKVDVAVNIMFSAITARLTINGLSSGVIKKMVQK